MNIPTQTTTLATTYTKNFFESHANLLISYEMLSKYLKTKVTSITDFGCGCGLLVECLLKQGIEAFGIDGSVGAKDTWNIDHLSQYSILDFTQELSVTDIPRTEYTISTEVAEHLDAKYARNFIKYLTIHKPKNVYFGAATPYQDHGINPTHVNEQPFEYWVKIFNEFGYDIDIKETHDLKVFFGQNINSFVKGWWYVKNMFVFKKIAEINASDFIDLGQALYYPIINMNSPTSQLIFERDRYEYVSLIMLKYLIYGKLILSLSGRTA